MAILGVWFWGGVWFFEYKCGLKSDTTTKNNHQRPLLYMFWYFITFLLRNAQICFKCRDTPKNNAGCSKHARALLFCFGGREFFGITLVVVEYGKKGGGHYCVGCHVVGRCVGRWIFLEFFHQNVKFFVFYVFRYTVTHSRGLVFGEG